MTLKDEPPAEASFNEAPALRGGERLQGAEHGADAVASMRPPHYAGENKLVADRWRIGELASMRPPHYAGENGV